MISWLIWTRYFVNTTSKSKSIVLLLIIFRITLVFYLLFHFGLVLYCIGYLPFLFGSLLFEFSGKNSWIYVFQISLGHSLLLKINIVSNGNMIWGSSEFELSVLIWNIIFFDFIVFRSLGQTSIFLCLIDCRLLLLDGFVVFIEE